MTQNKNAPGRRAEGAPCPVVGNKVSHSANARLHQQRKSRSAPTNEVPAGKVQRYIKSLRDECQARRLYARELESEVCRLSALVVAMGGDPNDGQAQPALIRTAMPHG